MSDDDRPRYLLPDGRWSDGWGERQAKSEPEVDEVVLAVLRQKVLTAFDVTEEDLAVLEQRTGYLAAKARHEYAREHFLAHVKAYTEKLTEMLNEQAAKTLDTS